MRERQRDGETETEEKIFVLGIIVVQTNVGSGIPH